LSDNISIPGTSRPGYLVEWYIEDPEENKAITPYASVETVQAQMFFADNLPEGLPAQYWLRARTVYTAPKTCTIEVGLCVVGKGKLFVNREQKIDLYNQQPDKNMPTPMFNQASMEVRAEIQVVEGVQYEFLVYMKNESITAAAGATVCGGLRIGSWEKLDQEVALREAVELAKRIDFPIVIAGLNSDYESEAVDRKSLDLPPTVDDLIFSVARANPKTVCVRVRRL
jgi:beta-glucosidase